MTTFPPSSTTHWMTLSDASALLGVHPITLRAWVDAGLVRAFRTPGGHRRFRQSELVEFLEQQRVAADSRSLAPAADKTLERIRSEIGTSPVRQAAWFSRLSEEQRVKHRELGQRLLGLLLQFVSREQNGDAFLEQARMLASEYGIAQAQADSKPTGLVRAFLFFRRAIIQATYDPAGGSRQTDRDGVRLLQQINTFMDELLIASLEAYEEIQLSHVAVPHRVEARKTRERAKRQATPKKRAR